MVNYTNDGGLQLAMTPDNTKIVLYDYPYEELSMAFHIDDENLYFFWDAALMDVLAKSGIEVVSSEEPPDGEVMDEYAKMEARHATEEWYES